MKVIHAGLPMRFALTGQALHEEQEPQVTPGEVQLPVWIVRHLLVAIRSSYLKITKSAPHTSQSRAMPVLRYNPLCSTVYNVTHCF